MKVINLSESHLTMGMMPANFPATLKSQREGLSAVFFLKGVFRLMPDSVPVPWEEGPGFCSGDLMIDDDPSLGLGYASDFVPFKPVADFSAIGTAYPPKRAEAHFPVRMRVGDREQELKAFGPWKWQSAGMGMTEKPGPSGPPVPVPITYANAWGGLNYPLNPLGCGREGERTHLLEFPDAYITNRQFMSGPAVLAPMPPDSPLRQSKLGSYGKEWLEKRWPWLPADFDYSYFNAAHPKRWMEGYLRGDESLRFENMHPQHPVYESRLPGLRARCFVTQTTNWKVGLKPEEAQTSFHEVPMVLDTVWVDMEQEKLVLIWRGSIPVRSLKFRDIENLMILTEPMEESSLQGKRGVDAKGLNHYEAQMKSALFGDPTKVEETLDAGAPDEWEKNFQEASESLDQAEARILKAFEDSSGEEKLLDDHLEQVATSNPEIAPQFREAVAKSKSSLIPPERSPAESAQVMLTQIKSNPRIDDALANSMTAEILEYEQLEKSLESFNLERKAFQAEIDQSFPETKTSADFLMGPTNADDSLAPSSTSVNLERVQAEGLSGLYLEKMDFSGLDLSGVDFTGAILRGCQFRETRLHGTNFMGADLGDSDLTDADFSKAIMDHADLSECKVTGSIWKGAAIIATRFAELNLQGCDFTEVKGSHADFTGADITGASFSGASIPHSSFHNAIAEGCDFTDAILEGVDFEEAKAAGIRMEGADLTGFRGGEGTDFTGGCFRRAKAADSFWERSVLTKADFSQAILSGTQFGESSLTEADFDRCDLRGADFQDALMERAILTRANMLRCSFDRADMTGAKMESSNLYESGFWDAILLGVTWKDANVKLTTLDRS